MAGAASLARAVDAVRFGSAVALPQPIVTARATRDFWSTWHPATRPRPPEGDGRPVLLVPGFLAGDASLGRLASWLRAGGFRTYRSGIVSNVDCMERLLARLEARAQDVAARAGGPVILIGQSRGGVLGRALAVRRPDLVDLLVTLGSPVRDQLAIAPRTRVAVASVGVLGTLGVPGLLSHRCASGPCCARSRADLQTPFPAGVGYLAVFSPVDEVVAPASCTDPAATNVEVGSSHLCMAVDARVWRVLAGHL